MSSSVAPPLPIENYSVVQPSTQQRTYTAENICRFSIPSNTLGFIDPHTSYLREQPCQRTRQRPTPTV